MNHPSKDQSKNQQIEKEVEKICSSLNLREHKLKEINKHLNESFLPNEVIWYLYNTHGFPTDLTCLIAKEKGWTSPSNIKESIKKITQKHQQTRQSLVIKAINKIGIGEWITKNIPNKKTEFTGYEKDEETAKIIYISDIDSSDVPINKGPDDKKWGIRSRFTRSDSETKETFIILDKTCFYPEGGGPIGDKGSLKTETGEAEVLDCQKINQVIYLKVKVTKGGIEQGQEATMKVYKNYRQGIKVHHTATHLLNSALRQTLGTHVKQAGSLVEPYFLRFDFSHPQALNPKQIAEVEKLVLNPISQAQEVSADYKSFEQAQKEAYIYLKGENYPSRVRVLNIGEESSKELCGGIHVKNTQEIGGFKIVREEAVGAGIRRITAYVHHSLESFEDFLVQQNDSLRDFLNSYNKSLNIKSDSFQKIKQEGVFFWEGSREQNNPFLKVLEDIEDEIKKTKQEIIKWDNSERKHVSFSGDFKKETKRQVFHPLAEQMLELRRGLNLALPHIKEFVDDNSKPVFREGSNEREESQLPIEFFRKKLNELEDLKKQKKLLEKETNSLDELKKQVNFFSIDKDARSNQLIVSDQANSVSHSYLIVLTSLEDRKILSDMSDFLLSKLQLSALILVGKSQKNHPIFVNFNKELSCVVSAGQVLKKNLAPLCGGKGGGKAGFAQGSIEDREKLLELQTSRIFFIEK